MSFPRLLAGASIAIFGFVPSVHAQAERLADEYHAQPSAEIVVTAVIPRSQNDILSGTSVIGGDALARAIRPTIGETLAHQPGVSATSFGPNASRPVLRGLQGERIRILTEGIGSFDASGTSVDHAMAINPLNAERIEVLRGPAALFYGSSAIGGVVNVIDSRVPRRMPGEAVHVDGLAGYGSAAKERMVSAKLAVPLAERFVAQIDGSYAKSGDMRTGGFVLAPALRAEALASGDPEIAALAALKGKLPGSAARTWELAGGAAFIDAGGMLGISFAHYDNLYGVPPRYAVAPGEDTEAVRIAMKQDRADLRAEIGAHGAVIETIRLRAGWADYRHNELEPDGSIGTRFFSKGLEARLEVIQARRGGWDGAAGAQLLDRDLAIIGDEKFLPRSSHRQAGIFTLQSLDLGDVRIEGGARYEHSVLRADADAQLGNPAYQRSFGTVSASLGGSYQLTPGWRVGLNLSRAVRAPTMEELFARGNHAGTQVFELGDPDLRPEKSWGAEATLRGSGPGYRVAASAYYTRFDDYIYSRIVADSACLAVNGGVELEFPCLQNSQADARYYGVEIEGSATLATLGSFTLEADGMADHVRATVTSFEPAPRIPPLRLLGGLELKSRALTLRTEVEHSLAQKRVAGLETPTPGFTLVNASATWKPFADNDRTSVILSANNIFDVTARRHASFLKDYAPMAGRDIRLSVQFFY